MVELDRRVQTRGLKDAIQFSKGTRLCFSRFLSGSPLSVHPHTGERLKDGLPVCIPRWLCTSHVGVRIGFTVLTISRGLRLPIDIDVSSITTESMHRANDISDGDLDRVCGWLNISERYVEW